MRFLIGIDTTICLGLRRTVEVKSLNTLIIDILGAQLQIGVNIVNVVADKIVFYVV